jgi:hypothetical protein
MLWQQNYTTCTMHVPSLSNLTDFSFSWKFSRNFCEHFCENENFRDTKFHENRPIFAWFRIFTKIEIGIFVSTLYKINYWLSITYQYFEDFSWSVKRFFTLVFFIKQSWFMDWSRSLMASYSPRKFPEIMRNSAKTKTLRNSAEFSTIPRHGIPYNSAEFLSIPYSIRNVRK